MNINKILFLFLSVMMLAIFGLWQFAHTEKFADFLSSKLKETFLKNFDGEISFESIEIGMFPLSTKIKKFSLETKSHGNRNIYCNFDEVGFYFSPMNLLSSKLIVAKAVIQDGFVKYKNEKVLTKSPDTPLKMENIFSYYKDTRVGKALQRIKTIQIRNAGLDKFVDIDDIKIRTYSNYITLIGNLEKVTIGESYKNFNRAYDSVHVNLEFEKKGIRIKKLEIKEELEVVTFKGEIKEYAADRTIRGDLHYQGRLTRAFDLVGVKFPRSNDFLGYVDAKVDISGNVQKPVFKVNFHGEKIESPYFVADDIQGKFDLVSDKIIVERVTVKRKNGTIQLLNPVEVFDIKNKKIILGNMRLRANDFWSSEAFRAFKFLDIVKGRINGVIGIEWTNDNMVITPHAGLYIEKFKITSEKDKHPILINDKMTFNGGEFVIEHEGGGYAEIDVIFPGSRFKGKGIVDKNGIDFLVDKSTIDFLKLGKVAGVEIKGQGNFSMHIVGTFKDVWFNFGFNLNDFEIADYKLKNIDGNVRISLKNKSLYLNNIRSVQKTSQLSGDGELSFDEKAYLNLNIKVERASLKESYFVAGPIFKPLKEKLRNIKANYSGDVSVKIDFEEDKAVVKGNVYTEEISFYTNEYVDVLYAEFSYKNKKMIFDNVEIKKRNGVLRGSLEIDTEKDFFKYKAKLSNLAIRDIYLYQLSNIQYRGKIFGVSDGEGTLERYRIKVDLQAMQGYIGKRKVENGNLSIRANQDSFKFKGSFFGEIVKLESNINFGKKNSYLKGEIDAPDIAILMGLFSRKNFSSNKRIRGDAKIAWNISFNIMTGKIIDINFDMKNFSFEYARLALDLEKGRNRIMVENGKIKNWDIGIIGKNNFITSVGSGSLSKNFKIKQEFKLDASLVMLFGSQIENVYGYLFGQHVASSKNNEFKNKMWFESQDISLKIKGLNDSFSKIKFRVSALENKAVVENFNAVFGDGVINGGGDILLSVPYPVVDINFKMENSKISFLKRSGAVASANISLKGSEIPYILNGKISILHGDVKDEVKDMLKNFSTLKSYNKYVPQKTNNNVLRYLNYNLGVNIFSPVTVSNSLFDVKVKGKGKIEGSLDSPLLSGELGIVKGASKLMFKNHDFIINEGSLTFGGNNKVPQIKLVGAVDVDDYDIKLNVFGDFESTQVELRSEPPLPQQDILSLLALGVTSNMNKDLNEKDRQSITTLSFGSLVVEQLKLHEGLTSSLGLRLSVQPEFQQNEAGPLEGRLDKKESSEKVKTATKIKVQKKISNNIDLSLSSTLGNANEQKQIMNIIYQVNKNLSLEGIYEINSSDTAIEESLDSGGIDIKYRISF